MEEPVEIVLKLRQDVDTEGMKATEGMEDVAASSAKMKQEFEKNLASQNKAIKELTSAINEMKAKMGAPVKTNDTKLIAEKEKLTLAVSELEKKLKAAEKAYAALQARGQQTTTATTATGAAAAKVTGNFNTLNMSIQQVARELPVLAISPQMFIMAISNNLPILQDQLKKTRLANEALKKSGQSTVPVWMQVAKSLMSWQTALVAGITILTVFGKDIAVWVKNMIGAADSIKLTRQELKALKDELAKNLGSELGKLNSLFDKLKDAEEGTYNYYKAKKEIIGQYGSYLQGLDAEKRSLNDVEGAYRSLASAIQDQAREKALNTVYEQQGEQFVAATTAQLEKIREEFLRKFGSDTGEVFFQSLRKEIEGGGGLSEGMKNMLSGFQVTGTTTFTGQSGGGISAGYEYNPVLDAISAITNAQDKYNGKIKDAQSLLGSLYGAESAQVKSLIEEQQLLLDQAKLMPEATEAEIAAKNKKIEAIQEEIRRLGELGKKQKNGPAPVDKEIAEREKAEKGLLKTQVRLEEEMAAATIAAMQTGAAKKIAEIDAEYTQRKNRIAERLAEIEALEERTGVRSTGNRELLAKLTEAEKIKYETARKGIEDEARAEVDAVFADVNQRFVSQLDSQLNRIDAYYAEQLQIVKENTTDVDRLQELSAALESKHLAELEIERQEYNLNVINIEEEIALKRQEIANKELAWETDKQAKLLQIQLTASSKRLAALNIIKLQGGDAEEEIKLLRAEIIRLGGEIDNLNSSKLNEIADLISRSLQNMSSALSDLPGVFGEIGKAMGDVASSAENINTILDENSSKEDVISAGVDGLVDLFSMVAGQLVENKELQEEWNDKIRESVHQAALARIELEAFQEGNIFGVENPYAKAIAGASQYAVAIGELQKTANMLGQGQVQVGQQKVISGKNIATGAASGAAAGAAIGTIVPVIGTAIGAAIGGLIGGIFGAASKKVVPVMQSLAEKYGKIYDKETFELNPQILADYDKLDDATKKLVDNWEEIRTKALEAEQQMRDTFKDLAGDIGSQLSDALVNAFRNNDISSAMQQFEDSVTKMIENIVSQMVFAAYFEDMLKDLEDDMMNSFKEGGDGDIVDDIMRFFDQADKKLPGYFEAMEAWRKGMKEKGIDLFAPDEAMRSGAQKGIAQASQDSIDELQGRIMAVQIFTSDIRNNSVQSLAVNKEVLIHQRMIAGHLDNIAQNTAYCRYLEGIDHKLDDINLKGVKLK